MSETNNAVVFERWEDIPGYEGRYKVSTFGRVASVIKKLTYLVQRHNNCGYCIVDLIDRFGRRKTCYIHRLVAQTFLPKPPLNYTQVNHIDENKDNNCIWNVEYCPPVYNMNYGSQFIKRAKPVAAYDMRTGKIALVFDSQKDAAKVGFRQSSISLCIKGKIKSHGGFIWREINKH